MPRVYLNTTVMDEIHGRLGYVFDHYQEVVISVSGGKDSTLLFDLAYREAERRGRKIHAYFLDQEAEYQATIDVIQDIMTRPLVVPHWYQVPILMTNATSFEDEFLHAWQEGAQWMRDKNPLAIHQIEGSYPDRFYPFIDWFETQWGPDACFLVGLRAEESLNRYRAVIKNPAIEGIPWSSFGKKHIVKFYPIYDWSFDDVFYYFYLNGTMYNRIYDYMHAVDRGEQITKYRVSNLIHEKAYGSLVNLQAFEPETWERLCRRLKGVRSAARHAGRGMVYSNATLPARFATWRQYRDFLLESAPLDHRARLQGRFAGQDQTERVYKHQCRQILLNDYENSLGGVLPDKDKEDWREKWHAIL